MRCYQPLRVNCASLARGNRFVNVALNIRDHSTYYPSLLYAKGHVLCLVEIGSYIVVIFNRKICLGLIILDPCHRLFLQCQLLQ